MNNGKSLQCSQKYGKNDMEFCHITQNYITNNCHNMFDHKRHITTQAKEITQKQKTKSKTKQSIT